MKQNGRVHWLGLLGGTGLIVLLALVFAAGASPSAVTGDFMTALAKGNVDKLAAVTYPGKKTPEQIKQEWTNTVQASPYYRFTWTVGTESIQGNEANVRLGVTRFIRQNANNPHEDHYEIPLTKVGGKWLIHVEGISRDMYPFLPR